MEVELAHNAVRKHQVLREAFPLAVLPSVVSVLEGAQIVLEGELVQFEVGLGNHCLFFEQIVLVPDHHQQPPFLKHVDRVQGRRQFGHQLFVPGQVLHLRNRALRNFLEVGRPSHLVLAQEVSVETDLVVLDHLLERLLLLGDFDVLNNFLRDLQIMNPQELGLDDAELLDGLAHVQIHHSADSSLVKQVQFAEDGVDEVDLFGGLVFFDGLVDLLHPLSVVERKVGGLGVVEVDGHVQVHRPVVRAVNVVEARVGVQFVGLAAIVFEQDPVAVGGRLVLFVRVPVVVEVALVSRQEFDQLFVVAWVLGRIVLNFYRPVSLSFLQLTSFLRFLQLVKLVDQVGRVLNFVSLDHVLVVGVEAVVEVAHDEGVVGHEVLVHVGPEVAAEGRFHNVLHHLVALVPVALPVHEVTGNEAELAICKLESYAKSSFVAQLDQQILVPALDNAGLDFALDQL